MRFLGVEDAAEGAFFKRQHIELTLSGVDSSRVADDVDQPVERVQAAEQIVIFAVAARQKCREMGKADALKTLDAVEPLERAGVLRADAVDQNLAQFADLAS